MAELVKHYPIKSENVVAHIRKATQGVVSLVNTHPFMREMWGRYWIFAHNGNLESFPAHKGIFSNPVGDTDSERAFCFLLENLRSQWDESPSWEVLQGALQQLAHQISQYGVFNFMLSNGEGLFAYCSTHLYYLIRQAPFPVAHLVDNDVSVDFSTVTTPNDRVAVIATQPITDNEIWTALPKDKLVLFRQGQLLLSRFLENDIIS